jgi:hypothetical protein
MVSNVYGEKLLLTVCLEHSRAAEHEQINYEIHILPKDLNMKKVCAKKIPKYLSGENKNSRRDISARLLEEPNFLYKRDSIDLPVRHINKMPRSLMEKSKSLWGKKKKKGKKKA